MFVEQMELARNVRFLEKPPETQNGTACLHHQLTKKPKVEKKKAEEQRVMLPMRSFFSLECSTTDSPKSCFVPGVPADVLPAPEFSSNGSSFHHQVCQQNSDSISHCSASSPALVAHCVTRTLQ